MTTIYSPKPISQADQDKLIKYAKVCFGVDIKVELSEYQDINPGEMAISFEDENIDTELTYFVEGYLVGIRAW